MKSIVVPLLVVISCSMAQAGGIDRVQIDVADASGPPAGSDVIARIYEFDAFQQTAIERTAPLPSSDVQNTAALRADAAVQRDKDLTELQRRAGTNVEADSPAAVKRANMLAAVDSSEGPAFVRRFYAAQLAQYQITVSVLEHYLQSPDNDDLKAFVAAQLPRLRSELEDTRTALAEK
ncbi:conserved exported hypothetical protein [Bradyrhizobium sp. STM 3843]|nr:conserved exported hypothetical protein [Bradyrhizobium sp. STM 3843]